MLINGGFENSLTLPWGTGNYERRPGFGIWWNSAQKSDTPPTRGYMKIDTDIRHSGERSLRITNFSKRASGVFVTTAQRIEGVKPNSIYRIALYAKVQELAENAVTFIIDAGWHIRTPALPGGSYDWRPFTFEVNTGHNTFIDFRIALEDIGTVWLDDISVEKQADDAGDLKKQADVVFDLCFCAFRI